MQAVILAAGKGSRLHHLTTARSKAMLPILGKPIVEQVMSGMVANGVQDFILVVSPDDREITRYFSGESQIEAEVRFVYQPQRLGAAEALRWAAPLVEGDFILSACDNLVPTAHITRMLQSWQAEPPPNGVLTLMEMPREQLSRTGVVTWDGEWISHIVEKPSLEQAPSNIASLPLYIFPPLVLDYLPGVALSPRGEYELQDAIQRLIDEHGRVRGILTNNRLTLTSPADLLAINRSYLMNASDHPQIQPRRVGANTRLITPLYIERDTVIGEGCTIGPNVYIERGCVIGDRTTIREAVLLREAVVEAGEVIEAQVVS